MELYLPLLRKVQAGAVKPLQSDAAQKLEARKRAAEIFKKSLVEKKAKKNKDIKRKVLAKANLSESESDWTEAKTKSLLQIFCDLRPV